MLLSKPYGVKITLRQHSFVMFLMLTSLFSVTTSVEVNLALNKSYTISPKPNYRLCTDTEDTIQLTDGKTSGSKWEKKSTVGWERIDVIPEITIDLEKRATIGEIKVHSIGGGAGLVEYPSFIAVLVSEDGKNFEFIKLIEGNNLPTGERGFKAKTAHTFVLRDLRAEGRFIKVLIRPGKSYFLFLDEVEVIGRLASSAESIVRVEKLKQFSNSIDVLKAFEKQLQLRENIVATIEIVGRHRDKLGIDFFEGVLSELEQLSFNLKQSGDGLFSTKELLGFNRNVGIIRSKIYKRIYKKPCVCVSVNPMEALKEKDMPIVDTMQDLELNVEFWQGEYESVSFDIINCTDKPINLRVSASPLVGPGGIIVDSKKTFAIRRGFFVTAACKSIAACVGSIADALVLQDGKPFELEPGMVVQIWLTIFNPTLIGGNYKGNIEVTAVSKGEKIAIETLPINITVAPLKFPQSVVVNSCVWAYPRIAAETKNSVAEAVEDLNKHYTNVLVVPPSDIPFPKEVSKYGIIIKRSAFSNLDNFLQINKYCRTILFYLAFEQGAESSRFGRWMSLGWKKAFSDWIIKWVEHLKETGIDYSQFAMYPFDEKLGDDFYELAKLIKGIEPKIRIYANSFGEGPADFMRFKDLIDIWCLHDGQCAEHPDWLKFLKSFGREVWTYNEKGPGMSNDPYSYYRLMPWRAFKRGQVGVGFWNYVDYNKKTSWDDTDRPDGYYGVIYGSCIQSSIDTQGEYIVPSRRWEAWREGIEDYQYLYELQKAIKSIRKNNPKKANQAQQLLNAQVNYVLTRDKDYRAVYLARQKITTELLQLTCGKLE